MYSIMGLTGQVGGATARTLLKNGKQVRGIVRDKAKAASWGAQGVELAVADWNDPAALESALRGVEGAFVMLPANFMPSPGHPETRRIVAALSQAINAARPSKIVCLSSVGAQQTEGLGLITQLHILEEAMSKLPIPSAFIRPAWFLENFQWDVVSARDQGEIASFLWPLEKKFPMVATEDIGRLAAKVLEEEWTGKRVLELEGPERYSQVDAAETFSKLLGRAVRVNPIPHEKWQALFEAQGMPADRTAPRIEMLEGFNSGWIDFQNNGTEHVRGTRTQAEVFADLLGK